MTTNFSLEVLAEHNRIALCRFSNMTAYCSVEKIDVADSANSGLNLSMAVSQEAETKTYQFG